MKKIIINEKFYIRAEADNSSTLRCTAHDKIGHCKPPRNVIDKAKFVTNETCTLNPNDFSILDDLLSRIYTKDYFNEISTLKPPIYEEPCKTKKKKDNKLTESGVYFPVTKKTK